MQLDSEQIEAAIRFWDKQQTQGEMGLLEAMQYGLGGQTTQGDLPIAAVAADDWVNDWLKNFQTDDPAGQLTQLPQPSGLNAQLRPYQLYGYSWLHFFRR